MSTKSLELETQLIERAVEKRSKLITQAKVKAENIVNSAKEEVERIKTENEKQILSLMGSELRAVSDRIVGRAQLEGRKMLMQSRQDLLSIVFDGAEKRLKEISKEKSVDYGTMLMKLIVESASAIGGEEFIVVSNEQDFAYLKKNMSKINSELKKVLGGVSVKLDDKPLEIMGGVVIRNSDGTKTYYNTFEGRLASVRAKIEAEVAKVLGVI